MKSVQQFAPGKRDELGRKFRIVATLLSSFKKKTAPKSANQTNVSFDHHLEVRGRHRPQELVAASLGVATFPSSRGQTVPVVTK